MEKYLYFTIDVCSIAVPFIASFYRGAPFYKEWKFLWPAILLPGLFFIAWDEYFTSIGVWGFNDRYLTGIKIGHLPLEEILFFICIPYSCVFTYFALRHLIERDFFDKSQRAISIGLMVVLIAVGIPSLHLAYTATSFLFLAAFIAFEEFYRKAKYLKRFYFTYIIILIPFFIVNGILTGSFIDQEVVWYNDAENLGVRMGTIPVEDTFYGMLLLMMNVSLFDKLSVHKSNIN